MEKGKVEEYKAKLEKYEQKQAEKAKLFNIDDVLADSNKPREVYVEEINAKVRYGVLSIADLSEINKAETAEEKAVLMLYKMLAKADRNVTLDKVKALPLDVATAILTRISQSPLLRIPEKLKDGLKQTAKLNYSA